MKTKYIKLMLGVTLTGIILTSCYKEFDPSTWAPPFTINGYSSVNQIQPASLVAYWAFEGGLADSVSGVAGVGTKSTFVNGFIGKAANFSSVDKAYITFPPSSAITTGLQSFTITFWVNPTFVDKNSDGTIDGILGFVNLSNTNNFWGNIDWFVENGSTEASSTIKLHIMNDTVETWITKTGVNGLFGKWSNHTLTYDAATSKFTYFINGSVAVASTVAPWTGPMNFTNSGPYVFGCVQFQTNPSLTSATGAQDWASYLTGSMDEIRIYNTALTPIEINSLVVLQGKSK
jgi:hypothetical protein